MTMKSSQQRDKKVDYEIWLQGTMSRRWLDWFGNMTLIVDECSDEPKASRFIIEVADQAALLGQIQELHNLGYVLLEIRRLEKR